MAPSLWPLEAPFCRVDRLDALALRLLALRPLALRPLVLRPLVLRALVLRALLPLLAACARGFRLLDALGLRLLDALAFRPALLREPDAFVFRLPLLAELRLLLDPLALWLRVLPRLAA